MSGYKKNVRSKKSTFFESDFDEFGEYRGEWVFHEKESEDLIDPIDVYRMSEDRDDEYIYGDEEANEANMNLIMMQTMHQMNTKIQRNRGEVYRRERNYKRTATREG